MARDFWTRPIQFKIIHRMYWTPSKLYRLKLTAYPGCWKGSDDGTLNHMLWHCPKVQDFNSWSSIHECIQKVVGLEVPFCIRLYLLWDPSTLKDGIASVHTEWVQTAIMIGRKLLVQQWKSAPAPSITDWYNGLTTVAAYERVSFTLLERVDWHYFKWQNFL